MNTQLKKGDRCQSPWGVVTVQKVLEDSDIVTVDCHDGYARRIYLDELTRIPSHEERMEKIIRLAFDCENTLESNETVQLKVGEFVEFARHYHAMQDQLEHLRQVLLNNGKGFMTASEQIEKLLKGEIP